MHILLTNDDGIHAPGLRALRKELVQLGDVIVVAPATEQSAVGHSVTLLTPLLIQEVLDNGTHIGWAVEGRPADCVKLALLELLEQPPDLIVSGMNAGSNAGINVLYSGTCAAAVEGAFFQCTSIAISLEYIKPKPLEFERVSGYARQVVEQIIARKPQPGSLFNVNIPSPERGPIRGVKVVPQGTSPYREAFDRRTDPRGRVYFWPSATWECATPIADTDEHAIENGYIAVTPMQFDLTHLERLRQMSTWEWDLRTPTTGQ